MVISDRHSVLRFACSLMLALGLFSATGGLAFAVETTGQAQTAVTTEQDGTEIPADVSDTDSNDENAAAPDDEPYLAPDAPENAANVAPDEGDAGAVASGARSASRISPLMVAVPIIIVVIAIVLILIALLRKPKHSAH